MIRFDNISKAFEGNIVFDDLSLEIKTGESIVIIGQSGVGKSVLLKHIVGLISPDRGRVFVDDIEITGARKPEIEKVRQKIGMVFQGSALFDSLTVLENVGFYLFEHTF